MMEQQAQPSSANPVTEALPSNTATSSNPPRGRGRGGRGGRGRGRSNPPTSDAAVSSERKPPRKKTFKSGDAVGEPQPGKFPVVFKVTAGLPKIQVFSIPLPTVFYANISQLFDIITSQQKFIKLNQQAFNNAPNRIQAFKRRFESAALLAMAQQIGYTKQAQHLPFGDLGPLMSAFLPHLRTVRMICQQYGDFSIDQLGQLGRIHHFEDVIASIVRAAFRIWVEDADAVQEPVSDVAAQRSLSLWWLPMNDYRRHTHVVLCNMLRNLAQQHAPWIDIPLTTTRLFTGTAPPWLPALVAAIDDEDITDHLPWLFQPEPQTAAAWIARAPNLTALGLRWDNPVDLDLFWAIRPKRTAINLISMWANTDINYIQQYFHTLDKQTGTSEQGTSLQIAQIEDNLEDSMVVTVRAQVDVTADQYSLAACFPPTSLVVTPRRTDVHLATVENVGELRAQWIFTDSK